MPIHSGLIGHGDVGISMLGAFHDDTLISYYRIKRDTRNGRGRI